ncbi:hypothetical protein HMPREF1577_00268 [Gardnerella pickettii JCP8017A]|uniref:Uncharacterized protein n=1 Tax=Gardnerella pickettii JCP8017A TaxID=1261062 RepID=T2PP82_9BIFI|nr:hypothetical protein HMPREF1577_00268 [Gardnerella pickettii JCP8017A]EPI61550.1 hypothetical protein HMPREF1578_00875 [Gardnerella pickettii JCP8017B]
MCAEFYSTLLFSKSILFILLKPNNRAVAGDFSFGSLMLLTHPY